MEDDTDPDLSIPTRGDDLARWRASLCGGRGLEMVGPSRYGSDAFTVIEMTTRHAVDLWIVGGSALGAAALGRFVDLLPQMGRLAHPHLLAILDGGIHEGRPYLLVQAFEGRPLKEHVGGRPIAIGEAVGLVIALAWTVHYLHEAGLVELDIQPGAIRIADDQSPRIDLRRTLERRVLWEEGQWTSGGITGCEAPETIRGEKTGRETDVYALGAILYEMVTGHPALTRDEGGWEAVRYILTRDPVRPRSLNKGVDRALESICLRCLAKDPARRPASAERLAGELERWRSDAGRPGPIGRLWGRLVNFGP